MMESSLYKRVTRESLLAFGVALFLATAASTSGLHAQDDDLDSAIGVVGDAEVALDPSLWLLDFKVIKLRTITLLEGPYKGDVFWAMIYQVDNRSGADRDAFVSVSAVSDDKKKYTDVFNPSVERAIEQKFGQPLWGKANLHKLQKARDKEDDFFSYSPFKDGKKTHCVAVLGKLDPGANKIVITIRGLSNDLKLTTRDDGVRTIRERVYRLEYQRPEDRYKIALDQFTLKKKGWAKKLTTLKSQ